MGYISRGRGLIIHRVDCSNLKNISEITERTIPVEWEEASNKVLKRFKLLSEITQDIFAEVEGAVRKHQAHLLSGHMENTKDNRLQGSFTLEMDQSDDEKKILKSIRNIPAIIEVLPLQES